MDEETQAEVTPEEAETQEVVEEAQPSREGLTAERDKAIGQLKDIQRKESRLAERERKLTVIDEMQATVRSLEDNIALILDNQSEILGKAVEQPESQPLSYRSQLEQRRQQDVPKTKTQEEPTGLSAEDTVAAFRVEALVEEMGWDDSHANVVKIKAQPSAQKGLEMARKMATEERDKRVTDAVKRQLKEAGLTTPESGGPSAANLGDDAFLQSYSDGKSDDHVRAAKLLGYK